MNNGSIGDQWKETGRKERRMKSNRTKEEMRGWKQKGSMKGDRKKRKEEEIK